MLKWALFYAEKLGWSIIPINPKSKKPLIKWKSHIHLAATTAELAEWWTKYPDANIGVVTGSVSNLTVIDIDEYEIPGTLEYTLGSYCHRKNSEWWVSLVIPTPTWDCVTSCYPRR
jgi:hypothetical protein